MIAIKMSQFVSVLSLLCPYYYSIIYPEAIDFPLITQIVAVAIWGFSIYLGISDFINSGL